MKATADFKHDIIQRVNIFSTNEKRKPLDFSASGTARKTGVPVNRKSCFGQLIFTGAVHRGLGLLRFID